MAEEVLIIENNWHDAFDKNLASYQSFTSKFLPAYMRNMRWFGAKSSNIKQYRIDSLIKYEIKDSETVYFLFVEIAFQTSNTETYFLPVTISRKKLDEVSMICEVQNESGVKKGYLVDAIYSESFRDSLFLNMTGSKRLKAETGQLRFSKGKVLRGESTKKPLPSTVLKVEQSNSTIVYGKRYFLKIYRKLFRDNNPDLELTRFLSEQSKFKFSPNFAGGVEWVRADFYNVSLGLMQEKVENQGEAWNDALQEIQAFFKRVEELNITIDELPQLPLYKKLSISKVPEFYKKLIGESMLAKVKKLAVRTAQMHIALFSEKTDRHFVPESFTSDYTVWLLNRIMYMFDLRYHLLDQNASKLKGRAGEYARFFLENKEMVKDRILNFDELGLNSSRIRIHGDYHLGQVLLTGDDFCILDFEGEPESTIRDRKVKQPPIKDLAGLFRSYHYAVFSTIFKGLETELSSEFLIDAGDRYYRLITAVSLHYYTKTAMDGGLNIGYDKEIDFLLRYHLFEKAIYELGYELHARPDWVIIPLSGIIQILKND
jgi:maltose alpha-D-glucosyltransferase/alpha-amylase